MSHPNMEFPNPHDFEDDPRKRKGPRITPERMVVLGLLLCGGLFLGLAAEYWPEKGGLANLLGPFQPVAFQNDADDIRQQIVDQIRQGDFKEALALADRLVEIDPKLGYFERGRIHFIMKDYAEAEKDFTKLIEAEPGMADSYKLRAVVRMELKEKEKALEDAAKLAELEPLDGYMLESDIYRENKEYEKAVEALDKAIKDEPDSTIAYVKRYMINLERENYDEALADAEKLTDLAPAQGYIFKGDILAKQGKSDEAVEAYGNALGHDPTNATALNNRAYHLALAKKNLDDAARDVEEAIDLAGEEPAYIDTRGYINYLQGHFKQALADFNLALEGAREQQSDEEFSAEIYFHRGLVHRKLDEPDLAKEDFEKAKKLGFEWKEEPEPVGGEL